MEMASLMAFSGITLFLATLLFPCTSSQQGQQEFFFGNAQRSPFIQQQPTQAQSQQFSNFFQPINSGPFSPFRPTDISSSSQPHFQSFQQAFPSQPTSFQLPPVQSSISSDQSFNNFVSSSRVTKPQQANIQQPLRQQKQQPFSSSAPVAPSRGDSRFQFTAFPSVETQPARPNFQNNALSSTFQSPKVFSEVFQDDGSKPFRDFSRPVAQQLPREIIDDFIPQSRWKSSKPNADVDTNRLQRRPTPTQNTPSPQSRIPSFLSNNSEDELNDSNALGRQPNDYDEISSFSKTNTNFIQGKPVNEPKKDIFQPKTRFDVSTYRPQFPQQKPLTTEEEDDGEEENLGDEEPIDDLEEEEEEYIDESDREPEPVKPTKGPESTRKPEAKIQLTTYSPPTPSKARFVNNPNNRQLTNSQPEVTTFRQKVNVSQRVFDIRGSSRVNTTVIPITLKNKFKTGPNPSKSNSTFDVVVMNKDNSFVAEENFKGFVDSTSIDGTEAPRPVADDQSFLDEEFENSKPDIPPKFTTKKRTSSTLPSPTQTVTSATKFTIPTSNTLKFKTPNSVNPPDRIETSTTESWVVVASVQTSRSVSGARFIPSGAVKQEEQPKLFLPKGKEEEELFNFPASRNTSSTESIIDKLDRVQSELSSGVLTGGFKSTKSENKYEVDYPVTPTEKRTSTEVVTTTASTTTTVRTNTEELASTSASKIVPSSKRFTTTRKPTSTTKLSGKSSLKDSISFEEDLVGLLPAGFKARTFIKTSTTTTATPTENSSSEETSDTTTSKPSITTKSLLPKLKPKLKFEDINSFLPPGYSPPPEEEEASTTKPALDSILSKVKTIKFDDVKSLLPAGYKPPDSTDKPSKNHLKIKFEEPASPVLLPKGFKPQGPSTEKNAPDILNKAKPVDINLFLPPGFKPEAVEESAKKADAGDLKESPETPVDTASSSESSAPKVVFPSRPGGKKNGQTASKPINQKAQLTLIQQPKIQKGWPTRATTEFTGWPSPPTSTISIEELLKSVKAAATSTEGSEGVVASSSTSTTTTTTTPQPTTPGYCVSNCEFAATIKLVGGAKWVPELLDHNTKEWQTLANEVEEQLDALYSGSASLNRWYKKIKVDAFSEGSVLVDYFVELSDLGRTVSTADMKRLFHESLLHSTVSSEALSSNPSSSQDYSKLKLGNFDVDPKFTDFVVLHKAQIPTVGMAEQDVLLPQWAIAVIVIGLASLLFVLIFGITVLVSRHKNSKKNPSPLTEDMLHELNKNHMGGGHDNYGADDLYNMEDVWNDKPIKKRGSAAYQENAMPNMYDSWRSDWNGYYYNAYYGGGSNHSGGYATRRRSDYDTNF